MDLRQYLRLAMRNLQRNLHRNLATGCAIASGFAGALLLIGYLWQVSNYLRVYTVYGTRSGHLSIYPKDGWEKFNQKPAEFSFKPDAQLKIEQVLSSHPAVERSSAELEGYGLIGNGCKTLPFFARGLSPETDRWLSSQSEVKKWAPGLFVLARGRGLVDFPPELSPVTISQDLARVLSKERVHDEIPRAGSTRWVSGCEGAGAAAAIQADANVQLLAGAWSGSMSAIDAEIVGHFESGFAEADSYAIQLSLPKIQELLDTRNVSRYAVWLKPDASVTREIETLSRDFSAAGLATQLYPWYSSEIGPVYSGTMQFLLALSAFIGLVLASVVILSVFNSLTITIIEREQEIGTLRSLGFTQGTIRKLWLGEFGLLSAFALLVGATTDLVIIVGVRMAGVTFSPPGGSGLLALTLIPPLGPAFAAAAFLLGLSLLTTSLAIRAATRKDIPRLLTKLGVV